MFISHQHNARFPNWCIFLHLTCYWLFIVTGNWLDLKVYTISMFQVFVSKAPQHWCLWNTTWSSYIATVHIPKMTTINKCWQRSLPFCLISCEIYMQTQKSPQGTLPGHPLLDPIDKFDHHGNLWWLSSGHWLQGLMKYSE